jgi:hypothetical protein
MISSPQLPLALSERERLAFEDGWREAATSRLCLVNPDFYQPDEVAAWIRGYENCMHQQRLEAAEISIGAKHRPSMTFVMALLALSWLMLGGWGHWGGGRGGAGAVAFIVVLVVVGLVLVECMRHGRDK